MREFLRWLGERDGVTVAVAIAAVAATAALLLAAVT